jgi:hypothetical protein
MIRSRFVSAFMITGLGLGLIGCSDGGVGPKPSSLIGSWSMTEDVVIDSGAQDITLNTVKVIYDADGTSDYFATMRVADPVGSVSTFALKGDVRWVLDETILTRTLETMSVTANQDSEESRELAALYEQGLNASPPARFIVEQLDETTLLLLDPETGEQIRFVRD